MAKYKILLYVIFFFLVSLPAPSPRENRAFIENGGYAELSLDFLNPKAVFDVLKENFRVPEFKDGKIEFPEQNGIQKDFSLDPEKYNKEIEEETGVNLFKFTKWFFSLLSRFFSALADLFENAQ